MFDIQKLCIRMLEDVCFEVRFCLKSITFTSGFYGGGIQYAEMPLS